MYLPGNRKIDSTSAWEMLSLRDATVPINIMSDLAHAVEMLQGPQRNTMERDVRTFDLTCGETTCGAVLQLDRKAPFDTRFGGRQGQGE
jgi:hypothetical protein